MSKRPSTPTARLFEWRIIRFEGTLGTFVGCVNAPDQEQALARAVKSFRISEQDRWRLGAYKVKEIRP